MVCEYRWYSEERYMRHETCYGITDARIRCATLICGRCATNWTWPNCEYAKWRNRWIRTASNRRNWCMCLVLSAFYRAQWLWGKIILFLCRLASASDLLTKQYKERPPVLGNLSLGGSAQDLYRWYVWKCQFSRSTFHFPQQQQISINYSTFSLKLQVTKNRSCRNRNRSLKNKNTNNKINKTSDPCEFHAYLNNKHNTMHS